MSAHMVEQDQANPNVFSQAASDQEMIIDANDHSLAHVEPGADQHEKVSRYHQSGSTSWMLPFEPFGVSAEPSGPQPRGHGYYRKRCRMIKSSWKSENPQDWLPTGMPEHTAYSLALLSALSYLATLTKGQKHDAHNALLEARTARLAQFDSSSWVITTCDSPHCESVINENARGILLADASNAASLVIKAQEAARGRKLVERTHIQMTDTVKRVVARREKKRQDDIRLQRELWKAQGDGGAELVGLEYSNGDAIGATAHLEPGNNGESTWKMLRRQVKEAHELGKAVTVQNEQSQKLPSSTAAKLSRLRARTASQLKDELNEDDLSWDDTEDEQDESDVDNSKADIANQLHSKKEKKSINQLVNALESNSAMETIIKSNKRGKKKARQREQKALFRAREAAKVLARAKANSIRLPSEMMDFSAIGKLQPAAHNDDMTTMTGALNGIL